jgi:hypothetical protein
MSKPAHWRQQAKQAASEAPREMLVEEKCFSSTEKSPASAIFGRNFGFDVDFGA